MKFDKRLNKLEENAPQEEINIPIKAWVNKDRTALERLTGINYTWADENDESE